MSSLPWALPLALLTSEEMDRKQNVICYLRVAEEDPASCFHVGSSIHGMCEVFSSCFVSLFLCTAFFLIFRLGDEGNIRLISYWAKKCLF